MGLISKFLRWLFTSPDRCSKCGTHADKISESLLGKHMHCPKCGKITYFEVL